MAAEDDLQPMAAMESEFYRLEESRGWHALFQRLHHIAKSQAGSQSEARRPTNIPRNRYRDVLPIDSTRVKLNDENDYINANYVKVEDVKRSYILTQGPLQHTCSHFWQMVWEQNTKGILMLNKCVERSMNKCFPYWPQGLDEPEVKFGQFRIELLSMEDYYTFRLSHLQLENTETEETRVILHYHYTRWPDFGVPKTPDDFLVFLDAVRNGGVLSEDVGPCVVHCSAGIGRSGTFCLVDVCLKKIEDTGDPNSIDIQTILLDMRQQRLGLIQTPDQLRFSYIAILQRALNDGEEEEEEVGGAGSDSEEVEDDDKDETAIPNGPRVDIYNDHTLDDAPPPLPPRPPDLLRDDSPSPPPPPSLPPPGPPVVYVKRRDFDEDDIEEIPIRQDLSESDDEGENEKPWYANGDDPRTAWDDEEAPPPPPPRNESTQRGKSDSPLDQRQEDDENSFLGLGRGEEMGTPPLPLVPKRPPRDIQMTEIYSNSYEEQALINELTELERLVDNTQEKESLVPSPPPAVVAAPPVQDTETELRIREANELRRRKREERQSRLQAKVNVMQENLRTQETREFTVPWLLVGVAILVLGYSVYYYWTKT